ncbi:unnamed protein product [Prorocentrum cordatum]|uniref:Uncharacterized protein n=1 Tax=Prorocentrum cordatum TaxID=2364126 RepID=A0ABN9VL63_9DINO|nr:unnamed protein product [Polarella glacialis]
MGGPRSASIRRGLRRAMGTTSSNSRCCGNKAIRIEGPALLLHAKTLLTPRASYSVCSITAHRPSTVPAQGGKKAAQGGGRAHREQQQLLLREQGSPGVS